MGEAAGVGVGLGTAAQYLAPVFKPVKLAPLPPQTITSLAVHTAVCARQLSGPFRVQMAVQLSVLAVDLSPVLRGSVAFVPPQTITSLLLAHTAVCSDRPVGALV